MWGPARTECGERFRRRHLAQPVRETKSIANAEVIDGEHVGAAELEDQHHLDSPATDATHLSQTLDDCKIFEREQCFAIGYDAFDGLRRQIFERGTLRKRKAHRAQRGFRRIDHLLRCRKRSGANSSDEALENVGRRRSV